MIRLSGATCSGDIPELSSAGSHGPQESSGNRAREKAPAEQQALYAFEVKAKNGPAEAERLISRRCQSGSSRVREASSKSRASVAFS
jgi:hypothetical protein